MSTRRLKPTNRLRVVVDITLELQTPEMGIPIHMDINKTHAALVTALAKATWEMLPAEQKSDVVKFVINRSRFGMDRRVSKAKGK